MRLLAAGSRPACPARQLNAGFTGARPSPSCRHLHRHCTIAKAAEVEAKDDAKSEEIEFDDLSAPDGPGLSTEQVHSMMDMLCSETDIAEIQLEMGSFYLKVRRHVDGQIGMPRPFASQSGASMASYDMPSVSYDVSSDGSVDKSQSSNGADTSQEEDASSVDESLVYVPSPKVGILRRGRYVKGKRIGKGMVAQEGDSVKKGQTLGYVEQLGTFVPVEAPQAGELVEFFIDEGKPVEYQEAVVCMAPFFGGHIIGDSKHK